MENQKEIWEDIPSYEGYYQVSSLGRVKSVSRFIKNKYEGLTYWRERILNPTLSRGYYVVKLFKEQNKIIKVHQLVAMAFLNHRPCGMLFVVDHINNIKTDNRLDNLQVITNRENSSKDKKGTSKYTGVSWNKRYNKWESNIYINGKNIFLGLFESEKEASIIYQKKLNILKKINMKEEALNGIDFEMQELLRKQYESEIFEFSVYTKHYNHETKIHSAGFYDFFSGTLKDLDKRNYDKNIFLIEKRKPIKRPELDWCIKHKQSLAEKNGTAEKTRLQNEYNYLNGK